VFWLLDNGVPARAIAVVSFTRASSVDLRSRIHAYCANKNQANGGDVRVSTLHSLALRILQRAELLHYPADPLVLDTWEIDNIFDAEFAEWLPTKISKRRREEIRFEHEAFWNTGTWSPPNYIPPDPPITESERAAFTALHGHRLIRAYCQEKSCASAPKMCRRAL
jgi:DNA helicase II / ATP-dependent DNA helicase PcrA